MYIFKCPDMTCNKEPGCKEPRTRKSMTSCSSFKAPKGLQSAVLGIGVVLVVNPKP